MKISLLLPLLASLTLLWSCSQQPSTASTVKKAEHPATRGHSQPASKTPELMPLPSSWQWQSGQVALTAGFHVELAQGSSQRSQQAVQRFYRQLSEKSGLSITGQGTNKALTVTIKDSHDKPYTGIHADESYHINLNADKMTLHAATDLGALHALHTLSQLLKVEGDSAYWPAISINDKPRFTWRGLMLDSSRHFLTIDTIKRQLDGMAAAKLNVFHWHLVDDQGWRVEINSWPNLHQKASDGDYYTQAEIRDVVAYATARGIRVVPEIDVPGHGSAIAVAYPEIMSGPGPYEMEYSWGVHKPTLDPTNPKAYVFVEDLLKELTPLFPDEYFHIGGDEVKPTEWQNNDAIQAYMKERDIEDEQALQAYFNKRLQKLLAKYDRKMIGWDEIYHPDLPNDIVIQSWRGHDSLFAAAAQGYQGILSTGFYIDQPQYTSYHYRNDPIPGKQLWDKHQAMGSIESMEEHFGADVLQWHTWGFTAPRKRGSKVQGAFTLAQLSNGEWQGFVDFKGRSRRSVEVQEASAEHAIFNLDSWMGPTTFRAHFIGGNLFGDTVAGNTPYPLYGNLLAASSIPDAQFPNGEALSYPDAKAKSLILGAEATLWTELVTDNIADLRVWPRTFAISERLWSPQRIQSEASMYQRMAMIDDWASDVIGLQHRQQAEAQLQQLAGKYSTEPLRVFSETLEQAHYYHRHHEKSVAGNYDANEPLDRLADAMPVENLVQLQLRDDVTSWLEHRDNATYQIMREQFQRWQNNHKKVLPVLEHNPRLQPLIPVAEQVHTLSAQGERLLQALHHGKTLTRAERQHIEQQIAQSQLIQDEVVVVLAYAIESLYRALP